MEPKILFVCLGNICRSPAAEAIFRTRCAAPCDSAGTAGWHVDKPPYPPMLAALSARGVDASTLRARQVSARDFETYDLIVAMDEQNISDLAAWGAGRVICLTDYVDDADHVPDPYYTRDFDGAIALIGRCIDAMIAQEGLHPVPQTRGD